MSGGAEPLVRVTLIRDDGSRVDALRQSVDGRIEVRSRGQVVLPDLVTGEVVGLERPVAHDALYIERLRVVEPIDAASGVVVLELQGERERRQQREYVRVDVRRLEATLEQAEAGDSDDHDADGSRVFDAHVVNLSGAGVRLEHRGVPIEVGSIGLLDTTLVLDSGKEIVLRVRCDVTWSKEIDLGLDHEPVRAASGDDVVDEDAWRVSHAGLAFGRLSRLLEERVVQWVFQQQSKQLRNRNRSR